ncbi:hypothetical protein GCM10009863_43400 [Streptomyces axinellae]|uniref:Rieske domain-containing protein n=1 Tax=Streptomyces axinellae TaxID=552788 RepID=A0ABN3QED2_9ACTN
MSEETATGAEAEAEVGAEMICPKAYHDMEPYGDSGNLFHCPRHGVIVVVGPPGSASPVVPPHPSSGSPSPEGRNGRCENGFGQNGRSPTMATRSATRRCGA